MWKAREREKLIIQQIFIEEPLWVQVLYQLLEIQNWPRHYVLSCFSCVWLCNPMDHSQPGSSVHGILQARIILVGCHSLLQGIFSTQGSKPCLLLSIRSVSWNDLCFQRRKQCGWESYSIKWQCQNL